MKCKADVRIGVYLQVLSLTISIKFAELNFDTLNFLAETLSKDLFSFGVKNKFGTSKVVFKIKIWNK